MDWRALRDRYCEATPWPHLVVDGVVAPELAALAAAEVARMPGSALEHRRSRRQLKTSSADLRELGSCTRALLGALSGPAALGLVQTLTGIEGLEGDPEFCRAGVFVFPPGGWQRVHEDFPVHPHTGLWNRVIALLYCSDWTPGWGGELELWPPDMSAIGRRIEPRPGRLVLFETTSAHPHGVAAVAPDAGPRVTLASRFYAPAPPLAMPSPPLLRWSRRPDEHHRDVWPTPSEVAQEMRARVRKHSNAPGPDPDDRY